ncbi:class I SAM-dependent methyltransferase [Nocardia brasiliensis]|uniref:class I SAM-dependent methyltransferase n=1 Tax=Nocardia brasiliensis TaxID=37326 RepID=UPI00367111A4
MEMISKDELDGAHTYSPALLRAYDLWVLGLNNSVVWRCPTRKLLDLYNRNVSDAHLDIGPGTGWFLRHAKFPLHQCPDVALVDLNEHALSMSRRRLRQRGIDASVHVGSVLHPLPVHRRYTSVAASLVMHCVPEGWDTKGVAFRHIADVTTDCGVFFGATVLNVGVPHTWLSRATGRFFNRHHAFHNTGDDLQGLGDALDATFADIDLTVIGSVAVWTARGPRRSLTSEAGCV